MNGIIDSIVDKTLVLQIVLLIGCIIYMIFSSINFMDNYSTESISHFKSERNLKLFGCIILMIFIYLCGGFNLIF
jgi:hypothetical protein